MITSIDIARVFKIAHRSFLRTIYNVSDSFNLVPHTYKDTMGRTLPRYEFTTQEQLFYIIGCISKDTYRKRTLWATMLTQWDSKQTIETNWYNITKVMEIHKEYKEKCCFLYVVKSSMGLYKIGISENPEKRLKALQTAHGATLEVVTTIKYTDRQEAMNAEKILHTLHKKYRAEGEWFTTIKKSFLFSTKR